MCIYIKKRKDKERIAHVNNTNHNLYYSLLINLQPYNIFHDINLSTESASHAMLRTHNLKTNVVLIHTFW